MNCYHYILIVITLIILIMELCYFLKEKKDVSNDSSSKKNKEVQKNSMFSPEKRGQRLFLYFIYLFPLIFSAIRPGESGFNIFDSIKSNMSFYATALTITFAVYSFLETQKATEKDRKEREEQQNKEREDRENQREQERREREDQREQERRERENRDSILKEKELEAERDHYRPIFVIEKDEINDNNQIRLLMKNENLYLEHIVYYRYENGKYIKGREQHLKSNQILNGLPNSNFYITAKTLMGETILFYFFYPDKIKYYYYLNPNKNPVKPSYRKSDNYTGTDLNEIWGTYNKLYTLKENNESDKSTVLRDAFPIRINLVIYPIHNEMDLFNVCYIKMFFYDIFYYLYKHTLENKEFDKSLYKLLKHLIDILKNINNHIKFTKDETKCGDFLIELSKHSTQLESQNLTYENFINTPYSLIIAEKYLNYVKKYLNNSSDNIDISYNKNNPAEVFQYLNMIESHVDSLSDSDFDKLKKVLQILMLIFKIIEFDNNIPNDNIYLNEAKSYLLEYLGYFTEDY